MLIRSLVNIYSLCNKLVTSRKFMGNKSSFIVRVTPKLGAQLIVDLRVFPEGQEEQATGFALDVFRNCPEVDVMVFSEERDSNIISLFR